MISVIASMSWLILLLMPLTGAHISDLGGAAMMTTVAPTSSHRNAHQQQRLQQLQEAQQLEFHQQHHHHLRHEQHLRAELEGNHHPPVADFEMSASQLAFDPQLPMQQHHLRHHNRHHVSWEQRVFPSLRHQPHRLAIGTSTARSIVTSEAPTTTHHGLSSNHTRYFDRDGIFPSWAEPRSTRGPNWRQEVDSSGSEEESDEDDDEDYEYEDDSASNGVDEELARQMPRYSLFTKKLPHIDLKKEQDYTAYDQSDELGIVSNSNHNNNHNNNNNRHPSVANPHDKSSGKRNIFDWLFKQDVEKAVVKVPHTTTPTTTTTTTTTSTTTPKPVTRTERPKLQLIDANLKSNGGEEDYSNEDSDSDSESEEGFSNEQWNKIEHEHHLKQQKHQKELLALREKSRNTNTPLIRNFENEVSSDSDIFEIDFWQ
ncbi:probable serine/threonine-protein kinase MARK-A isoform X4 [Drosophila elegans]|uniref:probable serine/threonine-protein kinase MARK-A isoform X4 n=1 Tax=Drosophila elegans TaxID=30023 RepID=UPI0007E7CA75|nr:probable serine/threonine-protein kinase MARK-A isoform X4 [Drosophila elegans]